MLRAVLRKLGRHDIAFHAGAAEPVEVRGYDCPVERASDQELHDPLEPQHCGWRLAVCGGYLLLTYHHSFIDGIAVMAMLRELLEELEDDSPKGAPLLASGEDGIPPRMCEQLPWYKTLQVIRRLPPPDERQPRWPRSRAPDVPMEERRTRQLWRAVPEVAMDRLLVRCRAEGTTVQGALGAAVAAAMTAVMEGEPTLGFMTLTNCRQDFGREPESLRMCFGWIDSMLSGALPFWEAARVYKENLRQNVAAGAHLYVCLIPKYTDYEERLDMWRKHFKAHGTKRCTFELSAAISNRGSFRLASASRRITSLHFVRQARLSTREFLQVNAVSVNGSCYLTICYVSPTCDEHTAEAIADGIVRALEQAGAD